MGVNTKEFAEKYLLAVEKKNQKYFTDNNIKILDCVLIIGGRVVSVHITNQDLPYEIQYEIETMFWRS
jgi:uncharacterized protein YacL